MTFHVVQGEREMVNDCRSLARFTLRGIPPLPDGGAHIRVVFQIDADGLLSISAVEKSTGVSSSTQVKPSYDLTDDKIANMITDSIVNAQDDMVERRLAEQKVEASRLIETLRVALKKDTHLLNKEEKQRLIKAVNELVIAQRLNFDYIIYMSDSIDFRRKVILTREEEGLSIRETAKQFRLGSASVLRWINQIEPKESTTRQRKIDKSKLIKDVEQYPDADAKERAERFGVYQKAMGHAL